MKINAVDTQRTAHRYSNTYILAPPPTPLSLAKQRERGGYLSKRYLYGFLQSSLAPYRFTVSLWSQYPCRHSYPYYCSVHISLTAFLLERWLSAGRIHVSLDMLIKYHSDILLFPTEGVIDLPS